MFDWEAELNPEQARAVAHDGGHLLIVAGAGSGKTKTLACRVARLLSSGVRPERILLLTFSRRAAREMLTRAGQMSDTDGARRVWGGTFHAVANRLLRQHGAAVGLRPGFTVLDQGDNADLLGMIRHELGLAERGKRFPKKDTLASIYSRVVNAQERLSDVVERAYPWCRDSVDDIKTRLQRLHRAQARTQRRRLRRPDPLLARARAVGRRRARCCARASTTSSSTSSRTPTPCRPTSSRRWSGSGRRVRRGRRRRRAGDLRLPLGFGAAHDRVPRALRRRDRHHARSQLPLDAARSSPRPTP